MFHSRRLLSLITVLCLAVVSLVPLGASMAEDTQAATLAEVRDRAGSPPTGSRRCPSSGRRRSGS